MYSNVITGLWNIVNYTFPKYIVSKQDKVFVDLSTSSIFPAWPITLSTGADEAQIGVPG